MKQIKEMKEITTKKTVTKYESFDHIMFNSRFDCINYENFRYKELFEGLVDEEKTYELCELFGYEVYGTGLILDDIIHTDISSFETIEVLTLNKPEDVSVLIEFISICRDISTCEKNRITEKYAKTFISGSENNQFVLSCRQKLYTYSDFLQSIQKYIDGLNNKINNRVKVMNTVKKYMKK